MLRQFLLYLSVSYQWKGAAQVSIWTFVAICDWNKNFEWRETVQTKKWNCKKNAQWIC